MTRTLLVVALLLAGCAASRTSPIAFDTFEVPATASVGEPLRLRLTRDRACYQDGPLAHSVNAQTGEILVYGDQTLPPGADGCPAVVNHVAHDYEMRIAAPGKYSICVRVKRPGGATLECKPVEVR